MMLLFAGAAGDCCLSQMNWKPKHVYIVISILKMTFCRVCFKSAVKQSYLLVDCFASYMMIALVLCILLHIVSSLHISIDGNKGNDSIACIKGESSCQSLTYVADTINVSDNLKIEIISSSLNLQGSVIFTGINGLTLNGKGANIICNKTSPSNESGIVFRNCSNIWLKGFNIKYCGLYQQKQKYCGLQAILFYNCSNFTVSSVNLTSNNGAGLVLYNSWGVNAILESIFKNNSLQQKIDGCPGLTGGGGGLQITQYRNSATTLWVSSCQFINNSAATAGGGIYMHFSTCASFYIFASGVNLTGNTAGVSGGGIGIATYNSGNCRLLKVQGHHIFFSFVILVITQHSLVEELQFKLYMLEYIK